MLSLGPNPAVFELACCKVEEESDDAAAFVVMPPSEMATKEVATARKTIAEDSLASRRTDIYQMKLIEIKKANGIDPNAGGEFTCSKCKSNKTSHYEKQTRSSDEPMTVFVQCLNCGKRWRMR